MSEVGNIVSHVDWQFIRMLKECHVQKLGGDVSQVLRYQSCNHILTELDHDESKARDLLYYAGGVPLRPLLSSVDVVDSLLLIVRVLKFNSFLSRITILVVFVD